MKSIPDYKLSRRGFIVSAAAASVALSSSHGYAAGSPENDELEALYKAARAEGGKLIVYAGGDTPDQQDDTKAAFKERFPDIDLQIFVDYSKFHDVRLDNQFATNTVVPDIIQLQTVQDFSRWKEMGRLHPFKPVSFDKLYPAFRDPDGAWLAVAVYGFSMAYDVAAVGRDAPQSPRDLADPKWKGKIVSSYPQDDDAVLYLYKLYAEAYGWDWVRQMAAQDIKFGRGTHTPGVVLAAKEKSVGLGGSGSLSPADAPIRWIGNDKDPFMAWGQRAGIVKGAKNLSAAKLYMAWSVASDTQKTSYNGWTVREDVQPIPEIGPVWKYKMAHVDGFPAFMTDRAEVERWRQIFTVYFGEVQGKPSPGILGLHPGA